MSLKEKIFSEITEKGPITVERYMSLCLYEKHIGYYSSSNPIGESGDFITSPEISQVFGELLGLWFVALWRSIDLRSRFNLVELGPGTGTLMADILRVTGKMSEFSQQASVYLIETSKRLRLTQKKRLKNFPINWVCSLQHLPNRPTFTIANEFLDALPTRQFIRINNKWKERHIDLGPDGNLFFVNLPSSNQRELQFLYGHLPENQILEICDHAKNIVADLSNHIKLNGGVALFIDYGSYGGFGDTLQAITKHSFTDPLNNPGNSDLTTHVNFEAISDTAKSKGLRTTELISQRDFLSALGIRDRSRALSRNMSKSEQRKHFRAVARLIDQNSMGELFKVLAITSRNANPLPVFE